LVRKVNERVRDDRRFTISDLSLHFPQISRTLLYDIVSSHLGRRRPHFMRRVYKNLCPAKISASIMAANKWKNSLRNAEPDNNKLLYETLLDLFLQRNGSYFLNKSRMLMKVGFNKPNLARANLARCSGTCQLTDATRIRVFLYASALYS